MSYKDPKKRQVGSQQRQVASLNVISFLENVAMESPIKRCVSLYDECSTDEQVCTLSFTNSPGF